MEVFQISRRCPTKGETELAKLFLEGKTVSEAMEIIGEIRAVNSVSRKAFTDAFIIMQELKSIDREPNWTEATVISNKFNISFHRVLLLAAAMFHAGWAPAKMTRRIIEKLRYPEMRNDIA
ncbi:MAG: hypothetical protein QG646_3156 [Euryarchaeota archaeon]|nr:hypothetical protein [Euryarchaeota archaeon]